MKIRSNAIRLLEENLKQMDLSLKEYVESSASSDPNFYRWLFEEDFEDDFDLSLTEDHREAYNNFIQTL